MDNLTHWKKLENPDYLGAYAFEPDTDMILTIKSFGRQMVTGSGGKKDECTVIFFEENVKPLALNRTNCKRMEKLFKTPYLQHWIGRKAQFYVEHDVHAFGELCDAVRVRPFLPKDESFICFDCKSEIKAYGKMSPKALSLYTQKAYGRALCSECATKAKAAQENAGGEENGAQ